MSFHVDYNVVTVSILVDRPFTHVEEFIECSVSLGGVRIAIDHLTVPYSVFLRASSHWTGHQDFHLPPLLFSACVQSASMRIRPKLVFRTNHEIIADKSQIRIVKRPKEGKKGKPLFYPSSFLLPSSFTNIVRGKEKKGIPQ